MTKTVNNDNSRSFYSSVHYWLRRKFGDADRCDNKDCKGISKKYDWAKKQGKEYDYKRGNFIQLCKSCHRLYDLTDELRNKMSESNNNHKKTHCKNGHEFTPDNIYYRDQVFGNNPLRRRRSCLKCRRAYTLRWKKENKDRHNKYQIKWRAIQKVNQDVISTLKGNHEV
jgi:hypothetical protein